MLNKMKKHLIEHEKEFCDFIMNIYEKEMLPNVSYTENKIAVYIDSDLNFGYYTFLGPYIFMHKNEYELSRFTPFHFDLDSELIDSFLHDEKSKNKYYDCIRNHPDLDEFRNDLKKEMSDSEYTKFLNSYDFIYSAESYFDDELNIQLYEVLCDSDYTIVEQLLKNVFEEYRSDLESEAHGIWSDAIFELERLIEIEDEVEDIEN